MSDRDTQNNQAPERTGMKPWLKVVLFASLALNLAVAGLVLGAVLRGAPEPRGGDRDRSSVGVAVPYTKAFPHQARDDLRREYLERMHHHRADRDDREPTFPEVLSLLRSDPFDRAAFEAVLLRQFTRVTESQAIGREVLIDRIAAMSAADRDAYADRLEEALQSRRKHGDRERGQD